MKKRLVIFSILMLLLTCSLLAQQPEIENPLQLNDGILAAIFSAFGIGLFGIIQMIKQVLKTSTWTERARDIAGYVISFVASASCTVAVLVSMQKFTILRLVLYTLGVWFEASGIWKGMKELVKKHA